MYADTPHRHQLTDFYSCLDIQLMGCIFEDIQNHLVIVGALRRSSQSQSKGRFEVGQHLLVCVCRSMVGFIHDEVIKGIVFKSIQVQRHTLHVAADHVGVRLFYALHITPNGYTGPKLAKCLRCLIYQFLGMGQEQYSASAAFGIHHRRNGFSRSGGVI